MMKNKDLFSSSESTERGRDSMSLPLESVWIRKDGSHIKFSLMSHTELKEARSFCDEMLYCTERKKYGKFVLMDKAAICTLCCKAELLLRWMKEEVGYTRIKCLDDIQSVIALNSDILTPESINTYPASGIMDGLPEHLSDVPLVFLMRAASLSLDMFDNTLVSLSLLKHIGIRLTQKELRSELFSRSADGKPESRSEVIRVKENLPAGTVFRKKEGGLSYHQLHMALNLKSANYWEMSDEELRLLSDKLMPKLEARSRSQAEKWKSLLEKICIELDKKDH